MAPALNDKELHILPQVEEIGDINQKLYRLVSNILEQPEDINHVHSLINQLEDKITQLKKATKNYDVDAAKVHQQFGRNEHIPETTNPKDDKDRVYWSPEDAAQLKADIVEEVVEKLRPEIPVPTNFEEPVQVEFTEQEHRTFVHPAEAKEQMDNPRDDEKRKQIRRNINEANKNKAKKKLKKSFNFNKKD